MITRHYSSWVPPFGNFRVKGCLGPHRNLSHPATSFIVFWCQGIHRMLLLLYTAKTQNCAFIMKPPEKKWFHIFATYFDPIKIFLWPATLHFDPIKICVALLLNLNSLNCNEPTYLSLTNNGFLSSILPHKFTQYLLTKIYVKKLSITSV